MRATLLLLTVAALWAAHVVVTVAPVGAICLACAALCCASLTPAQRAR